jgi:ABC-2 type transport system permease protein
VRTIFIFAKANFKNAIEYRGPILIWVLSSALALLGFNFFWMASRLNPGSSYSRPDLLTYYFLGILFGHLVRFYVFNPIQEEIQKGTINMILLKPVNYILYWLGRNIGWKLSSSLPWLLLSIPFYVFFRDYLDLTPRANLLVYALALIFAAAISFLISFSIGMAAFWLTETNAIDNAFWLLFFLLGGRIVPIEFFPETIRGVVNLLPFRFMFAFPIEIYLGKVSGRELILGIGAAALWSLLFLGLAKTLLRRGLETYGAFGG